MELDALRLQIADRRWAGAPADDEQIQTLRAEMTAVAGRLEAYQQAGVRFRREHLADQAYAKVAAAEGEMVYAEAEMAEAVERAREAREEADSLMVPRAEAQKETEDEKKLVVLATRREERAKMRLMEQSEKLITAQYKAREGPTDRTAEEWAELSREARWKAKQRERRQAAPPPP